MVVVEVDLDHDLGHPRHYGPWGLANAHISMRVLASWRRWRQRPLLCLFLLDLAMGEGGCGVGDVKWGWGCKVRDGDGDFTDVVAQFPDIADDEKLKRKSDDT